MATLTTTSPNVLVLTTPQNGITVIPSGTPLTRLNYFDGKFLRAEDLRAEQLYLRNLVRLSNKSSGHGVAHGFSVTQGSGDQLNVSPGLAVNAEGQVILLTGAVSVSLVELIDQTRQVIAAQKAAMGVSSQFGDCVEATAAPPSQVLASGDLFVITVAPAEALCGQEDVYGKLCEDACVTSTDRRFVLEGIVLRARPLALGKPLPISSAFPFDQSHLRSRVASAVFAQETTEVASLISKAGLESHVWCLGAQADGGTEVPLAVVDRSGASVGFLDAWTVRREKIDTVAKRYWQWRMAMRPWDVYLAQILQFQCQLADLLQNCPQGTGGDPCASAKDLVKQAAVRFDEVTQFYTRVAPQLPNVDVEGLAGGLALLSSFQAKLADFTKLIQFPAQDRRLLRCGIVETPSAGYLPVVPGDVATVNAQVRQWMGEGVDLRFCVVRPDYVPHALEEAQHMERISLTQGLDDPQSKPQVDVLVPNGEILKQATASPGKGYEAAVQLFPRLNPDQPRLVAVSLAPSAAINLQGAATTRVLPTGGGAFYLAGASVAPKASVIKVLMDALTKLGSPTSINPADLNNVVNTQPASIGTIAGNPDLFSRLTLNAANAVRITAAMRAGAAAVAPLPVAQQVAAIWVQLSSSLNPFMLSQGETTSVSLRVIAVLPGNPAAVKDYQLQGELKITQAASSGATKTVRGFVSGIYAISEQSSPGDPRLRFNVVATYDANGIAVDINTSTISKNSATFGVKTTWQGDAQNVKIAVSYLPPKGASGVPEVTEVPIVFSLLKRNDKVLEAGEASHTAALSALDVIGAALKDDSFSDSASRLLFPPPPPPRSDLLVRATLDWVLFHRRRTKTCATETLTAIVSARRYQVFHLSVPNSDLATDVIRALETNGSLLQTTRFMPIDVVEFAAGVPALNTLASAIETDWSAASPPQSEVFYAAIASQGAATADGTGLALQRLGRFLDAISAVSPPTVPPKYETLPLFPTALPAPGLDGDIVVITVPAPKFTGHRVMRTVKSVDEVSGNIQNNGLSKTISSQIVDDLGLVQFFEHTPNPQTGELDRILTTWKAFGEFSIGAAAVVFYKEDTSDTSDTRVAQSQVICTKIGTDHVPQQFALSGPADPLMTSITILQVQALVPNRTARLLIWRQEASHAGRNMLPLPGPITLEFKENGTLVKSLTKDEATALKQFGSTVRQIEFFTLDGIPDAKAKDRAALLAQELNSQNFTLTTNLTTGMLPPDLKVLVPDIGAALDIVFIEVVQVVG